MDLSENLAVCAESVPREAHATRKALRRVATEVRFRGAVGAHLLHLLRKVRERLKREANPTARVALYAAHKAICGQCAAPVVRLFVGGSPLRRIEMTFDEKDVPVLLCRR